MGIAQTRTWAGPPLSITSDDALRKRSSEGTLWR
jgi:hypothetical protein